MIRTAMSGRLSFSSEAHVFDHQMAYLFAADRHDHLYNETNGIVRLLSEGHFVVSTRYYFSSYAYHGDGEDFELVRSLNTHFPQPDLTIYLDVTVEVAITRLRARARLDAYENEVKLTRVRRNYERVFSEYAGNLLRISGEQPEQTIHGTVLDDVLRLSQDGR
jgi:dTMP kinase